MRTVGCAGELPGRLCLEARAFAALLYLAGRVDAVASIG
jgi:hypothetical protein